MRCGRHLLFLAAATVSGLVTLASAALTEVPKNCNQTIAESVATTSEYRSCGRASEFTFDVSLDTQTSEDDFCTAVACLKVFWQLRSANALHCTDVKGLENVPLTVKSGQYLCFGQDSVDNNSTKIVRPGSGSGSGLKTTPPPTTPTPTTPEPTTDTPEPTTPTPSKTKKPSNNSGSGEISPVITTPTPETNTSSSGLDSSSIVAIVGVSVGVVAVLASLWFAASKMKKKKKPRSSTSARRSKHQRPTEAADYYNVDMPPQRNTANYYSNTPTSQQPTHNLQFHSGTNGRPSGTGSHTWHTSGTAGTAGIGSAFAGWDEELIAAVRIPYEKLTFDQLISRGGYGEVYRGTYRGQVVAIKTLLPERRRDMRQIQSFLGEVKTMAAMEHDRIVRLIGVAWDSLEELSVVTEFLDRGDLRNVLSQFEASQSRPHGFDIDKIRIALHVSHALTYLHSLQPVLLHRDLKSRNILLDSQLNAKLADFGVSREREDRTMTAGVGSSLWMAPEVMIGERYDEKADVFSLGVVLSELDKHVLPYSHALEPGTGRKLPDAVVLQMVSLGKLRVEFTDEDESEMAQVGIQCVSLKPSDRPTAAEALHLIHQAWRRFGSPHSTTL